MSKSLIIDNYLTGIRMNDPAAIPAQTIYKGADGQRRFRLIGASEEGRVLFMMLEHRRDSLRVVTAYPAEAKDRVMLQV